MLGMCPTLAVTTMASNGIGMGLATTFVLVCSNLVISLLKNIIPKAVRLPCFIVVIASFVTLIEFLMKGYLPELYSSLGLFLSLITVNCIILGRAEAFASKNGPVKSMLDGLGMGLGFTLALFLMGSVREILGAGTWFGIELHLPVTMTLFIMPAGGFFTLGVIIAVVNKLSKKKPPKELGCAACPNAAACPSYNKEGGKDE
ncbi:MAG: electron transport complex subunit E [Oscillospiraceae bacterium]|nr:electron transport complex subunit E [Oscillospiraceae bacterium]